MQEEQKVKIKDFLKGLGLGVLIQFFVIFFNIFNFENNGGSFEGEDSSVFLFYESLILIFGGLLFFVLSFYFIKKKKKFIFFGLIIPISFYLFVTGSCILGDFTNF